MNRIALMLLICLLAITVLSLADSPPANTIPIVGLKPSFEDMGTDFLCYLSWHHLDGLSAQFHNPSDILENLVLPGDTTGMLTLVNPWRMTEYSQLWAHMYSMDTDSAYALPVWDGRTVHDTTFTSDSLIRMWNPSIMEDTLQSVAEDLEYWFNDSSSSVWFYYGSDEAPAKQWRHMLNDSAALHNDNYIPNLFTLAMDSVYRPELDLGVDSLWQPLFNQVDSLAVLSWMAWHIHEADPTREMSLVTSCLHTITKEDWAADFTNIPVDPKYPYPGTPATQATSIRSIFSMKYQNYPPPPAVPTLEENYPSFIALDAYPFRLVSTSYQADSSYTPTLNDNLDSWMLDHYEECMDSTFIPAWNMGIDADKDISVFFVPQSFGRAGGNGMWLWVEILEKYILNYRSYGYRIPTPQEFRMTCNSSLIRQAKAILPYCLTSYRSWEDTIYVTDAGLLDENNIPFDAPYEQWVYRNRPTDDISYIPPDSFAPFIDGFDPLYDLPGRPILIIGDERNKETYLLWKFAPYGRLWRSVRKTFGQIARVAPELAPLSWWEDNENNAAISYNGIAPDDFRSPQIKVFTDSLEANCYLYYLNRYCRANNTSFEIVVDAGDFPRGTLFSEYALDHNRRFLVEGVMSPTNVYTFLDTLDAGEARLLQMIDDDSPLAADIRITDPDLVAILPAKGDTLTDYASTEGETVHILAMFYNMGMGSVNTLDVYLYDDTFDVPIDTQQVSFSGLSTSSCYQVDRDAASFVWETDSTDVGVHRLRVYTEPIIGEPDPEDNSASLVFVIKPKDYATEILNDPWDMTEITGSIPIWHTNDIDSLTGSWNSSAYTDSISGMFEGELDTPRDENALYLNIGSGSTTRINADKYFNFSIAGRANPAVNIEVHWLDWQGAEQQVTLEDQFVPTAHDLGPYDLSANSSWTGKIKKIWLEFGGTMSTSSVRIGWVKLTE